MLALGDAIECAAHPPQFGENFFEYFRDATDPEVQTEAQHKGDDDDHIDHGLKERSVPGDQSSVSVHIFNIEE